MRLHGYYGVLSPDILEDDDLHDCYSEIEDRDVNDSVNISLDDLFDSQKCFNLNYNTGSQSVSESSIILDTAAGDSLFRSRQLLNSLTETSDIVRFDGVNREGAAIYTCTQGESVFGSVMYSQRAMGNILSFGNVVDDCYRVEYDAPTDSFLVTPSNNSNTYVFERDTQTNIYVCDTENVLTTVRERNNKIDVLTSVRMSTVPIGVITVADNIKKYTRREVKKAELAREYLRRADYMSAGQFIKTINQGKIRNCDVTPEKYRHMGQRSRNPKRKNNRTQD